MTLSNSNDILSKSVRRRALTAPREDKVIPPRLLHRIKTYIGTTSEGPINNRRSYYESKGDMARFGTLAIPKKTDTKMELVITILVIQGYTVKSIADSSKELFGIELSSSNVRDAYKRVLFAKYNKKHFLNRKFEEKDKLVYE